MQIIVNEEERKKFNCLPREERRRISYEFMRTYVENKYGIKIMKEWI